MSEPMSKRDAQRYDAMRELRKASQRDIAMLLEDMSEDSRETLAWRIRDLAVDVGTVRERDSAHALLEFVAELLAESRAL